MWELLKLGECHWKTGDPHPPRLSHFEQMYLKTARRLKPPHCVILHSGAYQRHGRCVKKERLTTMREQQLDKQLKKWHITSAFPAGQMGPRLMIVSILNHHTLILCDHGVSMWVWVGAHGTLYGWVGVMLKSLDVKGKTSLGLKLYKLVPHTHRL